jgi:DNA-directed RNA polymerase subunit N (RpoN/RPB10)
MEITSILTSISGTLGNFRKRVKEANTLKLSTNKEGVDRTCRRNFMQG